MSEVQFYTLFALMVFVSAVVLVIAGQPVRVGMLLPLTNVPTVALLLLWAYERRFWRWRWLRGWLVHTPDLVGTWRGTLVSDFVSADGRPAGEREAFLTIRQTANTIHVSLLTEESRSESMSCQIVRRDDGTAIVSGTYRNTPRVALRADSPVHYGGLILNVLGEELVLEGEYWTDRRTRGDLSFRERHPRPVDDIERARRLPFR